jgi:transcriptional regulator with XRE-family HTH domain
LKAVQRFAVGSFRGAARQGADGSRASAGLTQVQLAKKLKQSQSFVSKMEVGERRLDLVQLRTVCAALGTALPDFVNKWEEKLAVKRKGKK